MNIRYLLILIFLFSVVIYSDASTDQTGKLSGWQAGTASVDITPSLPMWMAGYGSRNRPGDSVALPLKSKAVALRDVHGRVMVIVTLDILGVPRVLRKSIEERIGPKYGIGPSQMLMSYSHTHSGPEVRGVETSLGKMDPERTRMVNAYRRELEDKIVGVIAEAMSGLKPADLSYGMARAGFAMNRRADYSLPKDDFRYGRQPNSTGPVDHDVQVLSITDADGRIMAVLFGYACHAKLPSYYPYPVQVIRFGNDVTLVALASEVVVDYSLRLKKELQGRNIWIAAYSVGCKSI